MKIKNSNGNTIEELQRMAEKGARFVQFAYTYSLIFATFRRETPVTLIQPGENPRGKAFRYNLISFLFGWWGIPSGPKHTLAAIRTNRKGGKDVTDEVTATIAGLILFHDAQKEKEALRQKKEMKEQEFDQPVDMKKREELKKMAEKNDPQVPKRFSNN